MKIKPKTTYITRHVILFFIVAMSSLTCNIDHGIAPLDGTLIATVHFRGEPPANTQGIYLTVAPIFPPHAINELHHSPNSLPIDQDSVTIELNLPMGSYQAISLWWYNTETKSNLADVLSLPLDPTNSLRPLGFELTPSSPTYTIDLYANWDKINRDAAIEGTIYFNGPFPENTLATAIAAFQYEPKEDVQYLIYLKSMDFSIDSSPYKYRLPVRHGDVNYLAVYWLPERANLTDFRTLGVYNNSSLPNQPTRIRLNENQIISGIDIHADWSKAEP
ncbi:hypothetical protein JW960_24565 [candidate division KSB1 bacterium]|nr:hypothetical protein [candidate division KSB1 bacterium]